MSEQYLIIDNGSYNIKAGFNTDSGDCRPLKVRNAISKTRDGLIYIGNDYKTQTNNYSGISFKRPFSQGHLTSWETEKPIWDYTFDQLCLENPVDPSSTHLTLTETPFQLPQLSISTDQIVFEEYGFNEYFRCIPGLLIPWIDYSDGKLHNLNEKDDNLDEKSNVTSKVETSNDNSNIQPEIQSQIVTNGNNNDFMLVIDSGYDSTWIIPMIYQCVYWDGVRKLPIGGKLLNGLLRELISFRHYDFSEEPILINTIKEQTCFMALDFNRDLQKKINYNCQFVLPDFKTTTTGYVKTEASPTNKDAQLLSLQDERFVPPESYYHPEILFDNSASTTSNTILQSLPFKNIIDLIVDSIMACPKVAQPLLLANIVLSGGSTKIPNFKSRLSSELKKELPLDWYVRIIDTGDIPQDELAWYGGLNLTSSDIINKISISKKDYFEHGSNWCQKQFGFKNPKQ